MKKSLLAYLTIGFLCPSIGQAEPVPGNDLLTACVEKSDLAKSGFCIGYLIGVVEGLRYGAAVPMFAAQMEGSTKEIGELADSFLGFCPPPEVQYSQHFDIVVNYLTVHPETRHESARTLVISALAEAFPCPT